jgi:hypothetical protein
VERRFKSKIWNHADKERLILVAISVKIESTNPKNDQINQLCNSRIGHHWGRIFSGRMLHDHLSSQSKSRRMQRSCANPRSAEDLQMLPLNKQRI